MKKILLFIILNFALFLQNLFAQQYGWVDISENVPADTLYSLTDVHFISENEGWLTTSWAAEIYHTTNGAESFEIQQTGSGFTGTNAIWMQNAITGSAAASDGEINQTYDGGANWLGIGYISIVANDVTFPRQSGNIGYCSGLGSIWSITASSLSLMYENGDVGNIYSLTFPGDETQGWACGEDTILKYTSGTWVGQSHTYSFNGTRAIYFSDTQDGWVVGGTIFNTADGEHWSEQTIPSGVGMLLDVFFLDSLKGWAVGGVGDIIHTTDGGANWLEQAEGLTLNQLNGVFFTSPTNGYAVGENRTLLKYTEITAVEQVGELPTEFSLSQNYPNPFNPSTKIKFTISVVETEHTPSLHTTLKVYDVLGNEVTTLVNKELSAGAYEVEFNAAEFTSGVYFYHLKSNSFVDTKKMILLR